MAKVYFSDDGSYGDGDGVVFVDTKDITDQVWDLIEQCRDNDRYEIAQALLNGNVQVILDIANEYDMEISLD